MRTRTATQLIGDVRARADQLTQNGALAYIDDATILEWINQEWAWLYEELIRSGEKYFLAQNLFQTANATDLYALPVDHYVTAGVEIQIGSYWSNAHRFSFEQRNDYQNVTGDWTWPVFIYYDLWANYIKFIPVPNGAYPVRHWYYPAPQRMALGDGANGANSSIDGVAGWELFVVLRAAMHCAVRDENLELASAFRADAQEQAQRILTMSRTRNDGEAPMARIIRGRLWSPGVPRRWWGWLENETLQGEWEKEFEAELEKAEFW